MKTHFIFTKSQKFDDTKAAHVLWIITYAHGRFFQFYLDKTEEEVKSLFEERMQARTEYEQSDEGWECIVQRLEISQQGEAWMGNASGQFNDLAKLLMQSLGSTKQ